MTVNMLRLSWLNVCIKQQTLKFKGNEIGASKYCDVFFSSLAQRLLCWCYMVISIIFLFVQIYYQKFRTNYNIWRSICMNNVNVDEKFHIYKEDTEMPMHGIVTSLQCVCVCERKRERERAHKRSEEKKRGIEREELTLVECM